MTPRIGPDSPLHRAWSAAADLVVINLLTLLACLPLITAGAALSACARVAMDMARQEEDHTLRRWWRTLRSTLPQSLVWWPATTALAALALWEWALLAGAAGPGAAAASGLLLAGCLLLAGLLTWLIPLVSRFEAPLGRHLANAARLSVGALGRTAACLGVLLAPPALAWALPPSRAPLAWFMVLIGPALQAYLMALIQRGIIDRLRARAHGAVGAP